MFVLILPSISSLQGNGKMNSSVSRLASLLEQARSYAMAHNTYVWAGFATDSHDNTLSIAVIAGQNGLPSDVATGNYSPIARVTVCENVELKTIVNLEGLDPGALEVTDPSLSAANFTQMHDSELRAFNRAIQFGPSGSVEISNATILPRNLVVGLKPIGGSASEENVAALQISRLTGQVKIFRR